MDLVLNIVSHSFTALAGNNPIKVRTIKSSRSMVLVAAALLDYWCVRVLLIAVQNGFAMQCMYGLRA